MLIRAEEGIWSLDSWVEYSNPATVLREGKSNSITHIWAISLPGLKETRTWGIFSGFVVMQHLTGWSAGLSGFLSPLTITLRRSRWAFSSMCSNVLGGFEFFGSLTVWVQKNEFFASAAQHQQKIVCFYPGFLCLMRDSVDWIASGFLVASYFAIRSLSSVSMLTQNFPLILSFFNFGGIAVVVVVVVVVFALVVVVVVVDVIRVKRNEIWAPAVGDFWPQPML